MEDFRIHQTEDYRVRARPEEILRILNLRFGQ